MCALNSYFFVLKLTLECSQWVLTLEICLLQRYSSTYVFQEMRLWLGQTIWRCLSPLLAYKAQIIMDEFIGLMATENTELRSYFVFVTFQAPGHCGKRRHLYLTGLLPIEFMRSREKTIFHLKSNCSGCEQIKFSIFGW